MPENKLPQHVAFIMDGNGRWAASRGLARLKGHAEGVETVRRVVEELANLGIPLATFYAFSTENWKRTAEEVDGLFGLMRRFFATEMKALADKKVRVRFIGNHTPKSQGGMLADDIVDLMNQVTADTAKNDRITAVFAINYSGRDELVRAAQKVAAGEVKPEELEKALDTAGLPDPDLVIRTSGEQRISNYLLWQMAYAELFFTPVAWPEFNVGHLHDALEAYTTRDRRFGAAPK